MDARALTGLFVQKIPSKTIAEVGDFVDYTLSIANNTGVALAAAGNLAERLARRLHLCARLGAIELRSHPRPARRARADAHLPSAGAGSGPRPTVLTYRVQLGSAAVRGDGGEPGAGTHWCDRVEPRLGDRAGGRAACSATMPSSSAKCFSIATRTSGRTPARWVFRVCRLYLEDGTNVITDSEGKYSLYGIQRQDPCAEARPHHPCRAMRSWKSYRIATAAMPGVCLSIRATGNCIAAISRSAVVQLENHRYRQCAP